MVNRHDRQTAAVIQLLKSLTDAQLVDVLQGINATPVAPVTAPARRGKPCTICGLPYPLHMQRWADDHDFERPQPRGQEGTP